MSTHGEALLTLRQYARWLPADMDTPISLYVGMVGEKHGILLESAEVDGRRGRYSVLACDPVLYIACRQGRLALDVPDVRLAGLRVHEGRPFVEGLRSLMSSLKIAPPENIPNLPPITRALYGYLGFGMAGLFNVSLAAVMPPQEADCCLMLPGTLLVFDHVYNRLCQISLGDHRPVDNREMTPYCRNSAEVVRIQPDSIVAEPDEHGYKEYVQRVKSMLRQGEAIQVVPSVRFSTAFEGNTFDLYRRLRHYNVSPYMFYMCFPDIALFGSSPEVMVRCTCGKLQLSPIAGTRRRGVDEQEDTTLAAELRNDPKERAEHVMLVDLGRNDLGRVAKPGTVNLERFMEVERYSHVMHLTSRIGARLSENYDALDVLAATFPAGTVSGAPKLRAMQIIREMENRPRGPYAGCIGWMGLDKDSVNLDMGITIRSMWIREGKLFWQAGGGIVHDSDPDLEWKEVCNKSAIMRLALHAEDEEHVFAHR